MDTKGKTISITCYHDPGHGWYEIYKKTYNEIFKAPYSQVFSSYSYQDENYIYLEEDWDWPKLLTMLIDKWIKYEIVDNYTNDESFIRVLPTIKSFDY